MQRKTLILFTLLTALYAPLDAAETPRFHQRGEAASYSAQEAVSLSMMGWGVLLATGIAVIAIFATSSKTASTSHSH